MVSSTSICTFSVILTSFVPGLCIKLLVIIIVTCNSLVLAEGIIPCLSYLSYLSLQDDHSADLSQRRQQQQQLVVSRSQVHICLHTILHTYHIFLLFSPTPLSVIKILLSPLRLLTPGPPHIPVSISHHIIIVWNGSQMNVLLFVSMSKSFTCCAW